MTEEKLSKYLQKDIQVTPFLILLYELEKEDKIILYAGSCSFEYAIEHVNYDPGAYFYFYTTDSLAGYCFYINRMGASLKEDNNIFKYNHRYLYNKNHLLNIKFGNIDNRSGEFFKREILHSYKNNDSFAYIIFFSICLLVCIILACLTLKIWFLILIIICFFAVMFLEINIYNSKHEIEIVRNKLVIRTDFKSYYFLRNSIKEIELEKYGKTPVCLIKVVYNEKNILKEKEFRISNYNNDLKKKIEEYIKLR